MTQKSVKMCKSNVLDNYLVYVIEAKIKYRLDERLKKGLYKQVM